jgi:tetratricopeptide (TPR) repeat protein
MPLRAGPSVCVRWKENVSRFIGNGQFTIAPHVKHGVALCALLLLAGVTKVTGVTTVTGMAAASGYARSASAADLTEAPRLASIYDTILAAHFDAARTALDRACPPAPAPACDVLREVALWWEIQQDPGSRALDARFERAAQTAIDAAGRWVDRDPRSGEASFYLAGAYAPLAQWKVLRGERLSAARDGKRIKDALERALELDPSLQDAWFGIGLYHYYADVAPAALKFLRMLFLLPGGDRAEGMREMQRARTGGVLMQGEADYQMHWLYLWYEHDPGRALELLRNLARRYPTNPLFLERIAEVEHEYFSDHEASLRTWEILLARAEAREVEGVARVETRARFGLANELVHLSQPARALDVLAPVVRARPAAPYGALALAQLARGDAFAALGDRANAARAYDAAGAAAPRDDPDDIGGRARRARSRLGSTK